MKTKLLFLSVLATSLANAQFSSGTVNMGTSGATVKVDVTATQVKLTLVGSSTRYLAINFTSDGMAAGTDGFIYNSAASRDYTFNNVGVAPSADAQQDWTVTSDTVSGSTRTVTATRSLSGGPGDYVFINSAGMLTFAWALGGTLNLANHGGANRGYVTLNMVSDPSLSVSDIKLKSSFKIFPNPATDVLNFSNSKNLKSVKIIDATGKIVRHLSEVTERIDVSSLKSGVYVVESISSQGEVMSQKLIKN